MQIRSRYYLLVLLFLGLGCVSKSSFDELDRERNQLARERAELAKQVSQLQRSNSSLSNERVALIDETEELSKVRQELESILRRREKELAAQENKVDRIKGTYEALVGDLESQVAAGQIQIEQLRDGLRVNLSGEVLFDSGSSELNQSGLAVLAKVAERVATLDHAIEVQGHTDSVPIRGALAKRFPSNWELAGARASRVCRMLEQSKIDGKRLVATSYGPYRPVADNGTPDGRAQNRRIEIRLLPPQEAVAGTQAQPTNP